MNSVNSDWDSPQGTAKITGGRDQTIDIMKGLTIFFIVYAHTYGHWTSWVYLFNLPVFMMISGYCWSNRHAKTKDAARGYFFDRARRLILPYWICNIVFYLLHVILQAGSSYSSILKDITGIKDPVSLRYLLSSSGIRNIITNIYHILCFEFIPQFGGPSWYLHTLFMVCILHCFIAYLLRNTRRPVKTIMQAALFVFLCLAAREFDSGIHDEVIAIRHQRIFPIYLCYLLGVFLKEFLRSDATEPVQKAFSRKPFSKTGTGSEQSGVLLPLAAAAIAFLFLHILNRFGAIELSKCIISNPPFIILTTLSGWIFLYFLAKILSATAAAGFFTGIGRHTMGIVFLHCVAFKAVSVIYVLTHRLPLSYVGSYPVIFDVPEGIRLIYTLVGVLIPTAILEFSQKGRIHQGTKTLSRRGA